MVARVRRPARVGVRGGFEVRAGVPALYELFEARADASAREGAPAVGVWYFEAVLLMGKGREGLMRCWGYGDGGGRVRTCQILHVVSNASAR